jgi:hypothetical protein
LMVCRCLMDRKRISNAPNHAQVEEEDEERRARSQSLRPEDVPPCFR